MEEYMPIIAHIIATLRIAQGDFALIDMYQGFDRYTEHEDQMIIVNGKEEPLRIYT